MVRPPEPSFIAQARAALDFSLNNLMWKQAIFFAERLVAECRAEETTYLLALAYFHNQDHERARWHLQGNKLPEARYLLATCCFLLRRWEEAEDALLPGPSMASAGGLADIVNGAAGLFLLGQIKEKQSKSDHAIECYAKCLELSPFMWEAYERWSWLILGSPSPSKSSTASLAASTFTDERLAHSAAAATTAAHGGTSSLATAAAAGGAVLYSTGTPGAAQAANGTLSRSGYDAGSPTAGGARSQNAPPRNEREPAVHGSRKDRRAAEQLRQGFGGPGGGGSGGGPGRGEAKDFGSLSSRRQGASVGSSVGGGGSSGEGGGGGSADSGADLTLAQLLQKLGLALHALHDFRGGQTLQLLGSLPRRHYETGYVLDLVGLCHFEAADYKKAEQVFQQVFHSEPQRVEGLEIYSSTLWHLKKDIELGFLAQQVLQGNRLNPQVWCVVGNCFSLQKEHDTAIKFFKRAIQVDPSFTYAFTLCGHEFVANEKFDKAIPMYQQALSIDPRHYNAWWGLGNIYHRQEEHENAERHFLKALEINRSNSVLRCYLGMVLDALDKPLDALANFELACQGEPPNGMAYFHKACVLMNLERFEEALVDLKKVRCLAPKEACVHFQLGKVYMRLQRDKKALQHFNIAMDLNRDSKDLHTIKTHIERLNVRDVKDADPLELATAGWRGGGHGGGGSAHFDRLEQQHFLPAAGAAPASQVHVQLSGGSSGSPPHRHHAGGTRGASPAAAAAARQPPPMDALQTPARGGGTSSAYGPPSGGPGGSHGHSHGGGGGGGGAAGRWGSSRGASLYAAGRGGAGGSPGTPAWQAGAPGPPVSGVHPSGGGGGSGSFR